MTVRVVTPPTPIVTWDEAKAQIRELDDFDKSVVEGYIAAATAWLDGPAGWLGRSLGMQVLELRGWRFPDCRLPYGPVIEILGVKHLDGDGVEQTVEPEAYRTLLDGTLLPVSGGAWPATLGDPEAVRIEYRAGYATLAGETWTNTVPAPIKQAILLLVGHWHANRETVVTGTIATSLPFGVEALLSPFRVWSL